MFGCRSLDMPSLVFPLRSVTGCATRRSSANATEVVSMIDGASWIQGVFLDRQLKFFVWVLLQVA